MHKQSYIGQYVLYQNPSDQELDCQIFEITNISESSDKKRGKFEYELVYALNFGSEYKSHRDNKLKNLHITVQAFKDQIYALRPIVFSCIQDIKVGDQIFGPTLGFAGHATKTTDDYTVWNVWEKTLIGSPDAKDFTSAVFIGVPLHYKPETGIIKVPLLSHMETQTWYLLEKFNEKE